MEAVVEFQAFCDDNNRFLVKEVAIVSQGCQIQIVFAPPFDKTLLSSKAQRAARWLTRNYHKIRWEEGRVPFSAALMKALLRPFTVVHTKGLEKVRFLRKFHSDVRNVTVTLSQDYDSNYTVNCVLESHSTYSDCECALRNALFVYKSLFHH